MPSRLRPGGLSSCWSGCPQGNNVATFFALRSSLTVVNTHVWLAQEDWKPTCLGELALGGVQRQSSWPLTTTILAGGRSAGKA